MIDKESGELLQKQAIHLVSEHDYNVQFFQQPVCYPMLKYLLKPNDFMAKIDLKEAYLTVPIWKGHQQFPRFLWKGTQWEFACLPFGIASAPRVFTKILKPIIGLLRKRGIRPIIYLDDFLLMAYTEETLTYHVTWTVTLLEMLGFVVNYQKSQLNPTPTIVSGFPCKFIYVKNLPFLGQSKRVSEESVRKTSDQGASSASRETRCFDPGSVPSTPSLSAHPSSQKPQSNSSWGLRVPSMLDRGSPRRTKMERQILRTPPHLTIETDASTVERGACCGNFQTRGLCSRSERLLHINCLELLAGGFALKSFLKNKCNIHVKLVMDNTAAVSYINKMGGATSLVLSSLAFDLWQWCRERSITVEAHHFPGRLNIVADFESRAYPDSSDWQLEKSIFQGINQMGSIHNRSFFEQTDNTTTQVCELETRGKGSGCLYSGLEPAQEIRISSICLDKAVSKVSSATTKCLS